MRASGAKIRAVTTGILQQMSLAPLAKLSAELGDFLVNSSDFELDEIIGIGATAKVYKALFIPKNRRCAAKKFIEKELNDEELKAFCREIEVLVKCRSRFVLGLCGFTVVSPFIIATDYIVNGSLSAALERKILSPTNKTLIAMGIAAGMTKIHAAGIIHRDLKPWNVILDNEMLPRICDFGLAKFQGEEDELKSDAGTPDWMAPELFEEGGYTNKVDVYAFGIMMWEMCTEQSPFPGLSPIQVAFKVSREGLRPQFPESMSPVLVEFIKKCWDQDPEKRPTFREICGEFEQMKVYFEGTDLKRMEKFVEFVRGELTEEKQLCPLASKDVRVKRRKMDRKDRDRSCDSGNNDVWVMQAQELLTHPDTSEEDIEKLLKDLKRKIRRTSKLNAFLAGELHMCLPIDNREVAHKSLKLLLDITKRKPEIVTEQLLKRYKVGCRLYPKQMLVVVAPFLECFDEMEGNWKVVDWLIKHADLFLLGAGAPLLHTFYFLCSNFAQFYQARFSYIINIMNAAALCYNIDTVKTTYSFIAAFYDQQIHIPPSVLAAHVCDPEVRDGALWYLANCQAPEVTKELMEALLSAVPHAPLAMQLIYQFLSDSFDHSKTLVSLGGDWMISPSLTLENVISMILIIGKYPLLRPKIAAMPQLADVLLAMIETEKIEIIDMCCHIIVKFVTQRGFLKLLVDVEFFEKYFEVVKLLNAPASTKEFLIVTDTVSRVGFVEPLTDCLPFIINLAKQPEFTIPVLSALASLGQHEKPRMEMKKANIKQILKEIPISPEMQVYLDSLNQLL